MSTVTTFSAVLDTLAGDGDRWSALIPRSWANGRTVFGGLQVALSVRAMRAALTVALGEGNGGIAAPVRAGTR